MAASAKYMPWFRHHGKSYLLSVEASSRQIRPRGHDDRPEILGPDHMARWVRHQLQPNKGHQCLHHILVSFLYIFLCVFCGTSVPNILLPDDDIDADTNANISTNNNDSGILSAISLCDTIHLSVGSVANTPASLFYPTRDRITAADWDLYIHFNL
ncbi:hypothetical protein Goshw_018677 [Gossypium schwendimanii]|uniref:Uncharacterized protein n=1 Tax=Gossypium schwendimanii TaxID=34291 RepID=A0A7J9L4B1_GOSSC|nr:hypothetical protein [Gossypium schwendimanii]